MSYISAIQKGDDVIVWERSPSGEREVQLYSAPMYFYVDDPNGKYTTIYNTKVKKVEAFSADEFKALKKQCDNKGLRTWESDIPPVLRTLANHYYGVEAPKLHTSFYDIEVNYDKDIGFAGIDNPYAPINSVTLLHYWKNEIVLIAIPPEEGWTAKRLQKECLDIKPIASKYSLTVILCDDEKELLLNFIDQIEDSDVICGWNSDMFDTPYVGKRLIANFGERALNKLDFPEAVPRWREVKSRMTQKVIGTTLDLQGRVNLDYMNLVKKYEPGERPSYRLAAIADDTLVNSDGTPSLPKLEYEGSLSDLYRDNFAFFVRYNIRDTEILGGFEDKLGYVELANQMVHMSCGLFSHVLGTLKLAEYAIVNHCHFKLKQVVNTFERISDEEDRSIEGALVLEPKIGMHEWIGSIDIISLYPSSIRSINISPETLIGQFDECIEAADAIEKATSTVLRLRLESGDEIEKTAFEFRQMFLENKWAVSGYGTVFDQSAQGIIPTILTEWFAKRKEHQALKKQFEKEGDEEKANYHDRIQYTFKIKLNSLYGALTNLYFRFFDIRMGESVTATGRRILRHQCSKVNEVLNGEYGMDGDALIYGDTDSAYFKTYAINKDEAVMIADAVADKVNKSFPEFMRETFLCSEGFDTLIKAGREIVSDRGIFVEKKRYILHLVDKEGRACDDLKVMGLDTKKSSMPRDVSEKLNGFIERLLKGEEWNSVAQSVVDYKDQLINASDITTLGLPKGISDIDYFYDKSEFRTFAKRNAKTGKVHVSGHVAAALHYNHCLEVYSDKVSMPIKDGMKIKVFYLIGNFEPLQLIDGKSEINLKSIALPTDIEVVPQWFFDNFKVDIKAHIERLVDNPLENILKAIDKESPTKQTMLVDSLLTF